MSGRVKQVPQDSTEWDRKDTGQSTDKTSTVELQDLCFLIVPQLLRQAPAS